MELRVLVIDDDSEGQMAAFTAKARKKRIALDHVKNYEEGLARLEENFTSYDGVILDARCFPNKESEEHNVTDDDHIDASIQRVKALTKKFSFIPYCIFTGYGGTFKKRLELAGFKVYSKGLENDRVLEYMIQGNESSIKYYKEHPEIMGLFRKKYLNASYLDEIAECLQRIDEGSHSYNDVKETAETVRKIMEAMYDVLIEIKVMPAEYSVKGGKKSNTDRAIYLVGKGKDDSGSRIDHKYKAPDEISWMLSTLQTATSSYLHHNRKSGIIAPSKYIQKSMIYTLFEILLWFRNGIIIKMINN